MAILLLCLAAVYMLLHGNQRAGNLKSLRATRVIHAMHHGIASIIQVMNVHCLAHGSSGVGNLCGLRL